MFKSIRRPIIASFVMVTLLAGVSSVAFARSPKQTSTQDKDKGKEKDKKDKKEEKEKERQAKQEREYQKIKKFSVEKYQSDPSFKDAVEGSFDQKQREHSKYAFSINTLDSKDEHTTYTGDKIKGDDTLYDNPMLQDYINRLGHSLVPKDSANLYAFKVILNPIPEARSLSTGTIYVSTGLLSSVDNEAQLAYVLGHEVAHIEKNHWKEDVLVQLGMEEWNEKQQRKRSVIGGIAQIGISVMTAGLAKSPMAGYLASMYAEIALPTLLKMTIPNAVVSWDKQQEDEADQLALDYMLNRNYDPREVPKFYANLKAKSQRDKRVEGGFIANAERILERYQQVDYLVGGMGNLFSSRPLYYGAANLQTQRATNQYTADMQRQIDAANANLQTTSRAMADPGKQLNPSNNAEGRADAAQQAVNTRLATDLKAKLDAGEIIGNTEDFSAMMAELKRDNGIRAFYYDMFQMARDNLQESLMIRSSDPQAHLYYGKVLKLTARTATEKTAALNEFVKAIDMDKRRVLPEPHLHRALAMMENKETSQTQEIIESLKQFVTLYQREHGGALPDNIEIIYDYMEEHGEMTWAARPAINVSTKNIEPINTTAGSARSAEPPPAPPTQEAPPSKTKPRKP